jgi:hypothetical protein
MILDVQKVLWEIIQHTHRDVRELTAAQISDLKHQCAEASTSKLWSLRTAAEVVDVACEIIIEERKTNETEPK